MDKLERPDLFDDKGKKLKRPPKFIPTSAEADIMAKTTSNIKSLEVETGFGEIVETGGNLSPLFNISIWMIQAI